MPFTTLRMFAEGLISSFVTLHHEPPSSSLALYQMARQEVEDKVRRWRGAGSLLHCRKIAVPF